MTRLLVCAIALEPKGEKKWIWAACETSVYAARDKVGFLSTLEFWNIKNVNISLYSLTNKAHFLSTLFTMFVLLICTQHKARSDPKKEKKGF